MIERILDKPVATSMFYGALLLGGVFALNRLPLELAPSVELPRLTVTTSWGTTSAETVEMFVTAPIEEIANTVKGIRKVSSTSEEGRSSVDLEFEQNTDMNFARLELNEKLASFAETLPVGVSTPLIERYVPKDLRELQGFLSYSLFGGQSSAELRKFAEEKIAPSILSVKGIARVQVFGGDRREIQIEIDPSKMRALGLGIDRLSGNLRQIEFNQALGIVNDYGSRTYISVRNTSASLEELRDYVLVATNDGAIRVRDVGTVKDAQVEPTSFYRINGKPSVTIVIDKEPNVNTLRVADAVFAKLNELKALFPANLALIKESDKSEQLRKELGKLYEEIVFSLLCIMLVLVLFLRSVSSSLLVLTSILFSLAGTFMVFWMLGLGLNLLTFGGLVLGFGRLVDDSIVVLDNIHRRASQEGSPRGVIPSAVREISLPVVASTITTIGALLPLQFLPQDLKPYFLDFGIAVGVSLLMSLVVSFTLIPTVSYRIQLDASFGTVLGRIGEKGVDVYRILLEFAIRRKKLVVAITMWLFGVPVWLLPEKIEADSTFTKLYNSTMSAEWFQAARPYVNYVLGGTSHLFFAKVTKGEVWEFGSDTYLVVSVSFPQGTEIERYDQIASSVEREVVRHSPGVKKITTRVQSDYAVVRVDIDDSTALTSFPFELKNDLVVFAAQTGGASISVGGFGPGYYSGGESSPSFYVKVLGYNYPKVKEIAETFRESIEKNPRIAEVDIDRSWGRWNRNFELTITLDRDAIARHGLSVVEVVRAIRNYTRGSLEQNTVNVNNERVPYVVKFGGYRDFSVDDLRDIVISSADGEAVKLVELINIEQRRIPGQIRRENQQYVRWISFEYKGPYRFGDRFVDATIKATVLPNGYMFDRSFSFFWLSEENQASLLWIAFLALVIVFIVTASLYESFIKPFIIILSVPFSLIGLFLSFYVMDVPFGRGGYAAVFLLVGIVVTNSIVLVDYLSRKTEQFGYSVESIVEASSHRVRPILMTSLTTIGGLMPMVVLGERTSLWYSLSIGTIGGMISSTLLTLLVVPIVYSMLSGAHHVNDKHH